MISIDHRHAILVLTAIAVIVVISMNVIPGIMIMMTMFHALKFLVAPNVIVSISLKVEPRRVRIFMNISSIFLVSNSMGVFSCKYNTEYFEDGLTCINLNECNNSSCDLHAFCRDKFQSFDRGCDSGYAGDKFTCEDIDKCSAWYH